MSCGQLYKTWIKDIQWLNHGYLQNSANFLDSDCIKKDIQIVIQKDIQLYKKLDNFNRALRGRLNEISSSQLYKRWLKLTPVNSLPR